MSWARLDDGMDSHPKMLALGDGVKGNHRRYLWLRVLMHTSRHGSGVIPPNIGEAISGANKAFIRDCVTIGLADQETDGTIIVHDWLLYADVPIRDKVRYYLGRFPDASANEVIRGINGGTREIVLSEVKRYRDEHPQFDRTTSEQFDRTGLAGSESGSRTPDPDPAPKAEAPKAAAALNPPTPAAAQNPDDLLGQAEAETALLPLLIELDIDMGVRFAAMQDAPRALAWIQKARAHATASPAGYFRRGLETGKWPTPLAVVPAPVPPCEACGVGGGLHLADCAERAA